MSARSVWIRPTTILDGRQLRPAAVMLENGRVQQISEHPPHGVTPLDIDGILTRGFVDLQVNGGGGVLFNQNCDTDSLKTIIAAHRAAGTTDMLVTVITDSADVLQNAVDAVLDNQGMAGLLGIHIEGPHISVGRRGTHAPRFIRSMDESTVDQVARLRDANIPVMITLAPEVVPVSWIIRLKSLGAVVSVGHSDATNAQVNEAIDAGANCFTHLFNAMSQMTGRQPGVVGAAINSSAYAGIICDGIHVADDMVGLAVRARPIPDRTFFVSDAMPTVGGDLSFDLYGERIELQAGRLVNADGGLAGAHVTMLESVRRAVNNVGIDLETALKMATCIPAAAMGRSDLAHLEGNDATDLLVLDQDLASFRFLSEVIADQQGRQAIPAQAQ